MSLHAITVCAVDMYCWRKILKITGTRMEKKKCQMHGQDPQDLFYLGNNHLMEKHGPGGDLEENKQPLVLMMRGQICGN